MEKDNKVKIINIIIIICLVISLIFGIYLYFNLQSKKNDTYKEDILTYLNQEFNSTSVIYGLLSYDFDNINSSISSDVLLNSYFMQNSIMNDDGVNSIYKSIYGYDKSSVLNASNYVSSKLSNCYYYQDTLKKNISCDSICSKSNNEISKKITSLLQWDNVTDDNIKDFCEKKAIYSLEGSGYFVNLNDVKTLYKKITNLDLVFKDDITSNTYYGSGAYLANSVSKLTTYVSTIESIDEVSKSGNEFIVSYTALLSNSKSINGKCILNYIDNNYYIVSNSINLGNKIY